MQGIFTKISSFSNRLPGQAYLWIAVLIFGAANAVTRRLTEIGSQNLIDGRNPISFCNVLFVGNLCALLVLLLIHRQQLQLSYVKQLSRQDWLSIAVIALLSAAIAPAATFTALSKTMVTNVVLIGRIEPPLFLALSVWLLRERINSWKILGAIVSFAGVLVTVFLQSIWENMMVSNIFATVGVGGIYAAIGAITLAISSIISKTRLSRIPLGLFMVFRTMLGTVFFFFAAIYFYGFHHFMDAFSPFLWQWMLFYGGVIIALGQICWFTGLKKSSSSTVTIASAFNPVAAVFAAYLILGELPTLSQYIGGAIILVGIVLSQIGNLSQPQQIKNAAKDTEPDTGFRGV
ncbi:MAG: DMT family transporter [Nostocaceae cyanobacterium]|nr:DMT family transporter [Nostocaceae cyanobacterium]